jgi:hypothetical protein
MCAIIGVPTRVRLFMFVARSIDTREHTLETRICCRCRQEKSITDFYLKSRSGTKRHPYCKDCSARAPERIRAKEYAYDYLKNHPCVDCGETDPVVLEFDHVRGDKVEDVSVLVGQGKSLDVIRNEIEKCEVRCGNCHRRKTARERRWLVRRSKV